jgi:uncharacterized membrane protein YjjP (DUF1212 family)
METPVLVSRRLTADELAEYLSEIGAMLLEYGCPSYRLEDVIETVAEIESHQANVFATPTALFVSIRTGDGRPPVMRLTRVKQWGTNLDRLVKVDTIFNDVVARRISITSARAELRSVEVAPEPWPIALQWFAAGGASAAAAIFFRGTAIDAAVAAVTGLTIFGLTRAISRLPQGRFLVDFAGGLLASLLPWAVSTMRHDVSLQVVVLAGAIMLVPGMTFTTGLAELAQKNLVSGAARLMEAFITFLSIVSGIACGIGIQQTLGDVITAPIAVRAGLGLGWQAAAMFTASFAFSVAFAVPRVYLGAGVLSGAIGYVATAVAARHLPAHVAALLAALAVCLFANAAARITQRPAQLYQLPGMMLLVPGSFGFLSLEEFLRGHFFEGAEKGFQMILIAGGLVMGVLGANVLLPARKLL